MDEWIKRRKEGEKEKKSLRWRAEEGGETRGVQVRECVRVKAERDGGRREERVRDGEGAGGGQDEKKEKSVFNNIGGD